MKLFSVEGNRVHLDGGAMFGNAPKSMWSKWFKSDKQNRIPLACRSLLVQTDNGKNILFEAGIGAFFEPSLKERYGVEPEEHLLLQNLKNMGIEEGDIDAVVLSHLHFDHAGGLLPAYSDEEPPQLLFPNANYYVPKAHWDYAQNPHLRERISFIPLLNELLEKSDRMILVEQSNHPDLDFVNFRYSDGHTIGLMISQINLPSGPVIFVTDLIPGNAWIHLPLTMGYDRFPALKVDEKQQLYESVIDSKAKIFFTHDPEIPCVELKVDEKGKYFSEPIDIGTLST